MTAVAIKKQLDSYLPLLSKTQQELLLNMVKNILQVEPKEKRISISHYNKELELSIKQAKLGKTIKHKDLLKEIEKW
ncbi:MAG TPA: hypothetical protein VNZ49_03165 [Bacteroidia bacterium]|jgi:hypothetical protein|nr:hypothetical protein [Bacteroidia bacterium]